MNGDSVLDLLDIILNCWGERMSGIKRKIARNKKKKLEKKIKEQLMMFDKLENSCSACKKDFDKKSKEHATTWKVVVREKEEIVRLYCPECWEKANNLIKEIQNDFRVSQDK